MALNEVETKPPYLSKTIWLSALMALAGFIPGAKEWVAAHPDVMMWGSGAVFAFLRWVSKGKINLL